MFVFDSRLSWLTYTCSFCHVFRSSFPFNADDSTICVFLPQYSAVFSLQVKRRCRQTFQHDLKNEFHVHHDWILLLGDALSHFFSFHNKHHIPHTSSHIKSQCHRSHCFVVHGFHFQISAWMFCGVCGFLNPKVTFSAHESSGLRSARIIILVLSKRKGSCTRSMLEGLFFVILNVFTFDQSLQQDYSILAPLRQQKLFHVMIPSYLSEVAVNNIDIEQTAHRIRVAMKLNRMMWDWYFTFFSHDLLPVER